MTLFTIKEKKQFGEYVLVDKNGKTQSLMLEFHHMKEPAVGDRLFLHEGLLNRLSAHFVQPYAFEPMSENETESLSDMDLAALQTNKEKIALKRIYG